MKSTTRRPIPPETVGVRVAAQYLDVCPDTIRKRIAEGDLPAHRVGRLIRIYVDDLESLRRPIPTTAGVGS